EGDSKDDESSSSGSNGDAKNLNKEQKKYIKEAYEFLNGKYGVSAEMVAGMMGNWMQESHINPKSVEGVTGVPSKEQRKKAEK
ncbi:phage tail tip lysozyme, partial [Mycobacterium marinum]|uniref:phage tail tip lysozyme n=1 Tax=Mycobacterium marinum TaxID=1781 RepID=UPI0035614023